MKLKLLLVGLMLAFVAGQATAQKRTTNKKTRTTAVAKKVTNTTGKNAPTQGCAVTNAKAVDLGLPSGTKWADRNVGAESPEAYGGLYRYGDMGKSSGEGCPTGRIVGTKYDVAKKKMGGKWVMPTTAQLEELFYNCSRSYEVRGKVGGYYFEGPNGNSIFLPLTGIMYNYGRSQAGQFGMYVAGETLQSNMYNVGYVVSCLQLWQDEEKFTSSMDGASLGDGCPIRAVLAQ